MSDDMIKKAVLILVAGLTVLDAFAQAPDTTSTVVGRKLNFEVPIFGITKRDIKPTWSIVTFDEISGGFNYLMGVPGQLKLSGWYGDLSIIALRYRPWRDGNVFSAGLLGGVDVNRLQKGYSFADDGSIVTTPAMWNNAKSTYSDRHIGLQIGYIREFGDWKAGAFVVPAFGTTSLRNEYSIQGISGIKRQDNLYTNNGFRLGFKAGVWYQNIGVSVGYKPALGNSSATVPLYNSFQVGISVRY